MPEGSRPNPFHLINKALRFGHCRGLTRLGAHDFTASAGEQQLARLARLMAALRCHGASECGSLAAMLATHNPGMARKVAESHAGQSAALAELDSLIRAVRVATADRRAIAGQSLYRCYGLFAASDMARMDTHETELLQTLHHTFEDEALHALNAKLAATLTGAHPRYAVALFRAALNATEHARLTARIKLASHVTAITSAAASHL